MRILRYWGFPLWFGLDWFLGVLNSHTIQKLDWPIKWFTVTWFKTGLANHGTAKERNLKWHLSDFTFKFSFVFQEKLIWRKVSTTNKYVCPKMAYPIVKIASRKCKTKSVQQNWGRLVTLQFQKLTNKYNSNVKLTTVHFYIWDITIPKKITKKYNSNLN